MVALLLYVELGWFGTGVCHTGSTLGISVDVTDVVSAEAGVDGCLWTSVSGVVVRDDGSCDWTSCPVCCDVVADADDSVMSDVETGDVPVGVVSVSSVLVGVDLCLTWVTGSYG